MKKCSIYIFLIVMYIIIINGCAQVVSPSGGKKDTLAATIVKTFPKNQSLIFKGQEVEIYFNEFIKVDNLQQQLLVTPNIEGIYETKIYPKGVKIKFEKPLQENTTYSLNFRNTFKDITESNISKNIRLVFSTGNKIDSMKIEGNVKNIVDNKPVLDVLVGLYKLSDTLKPQKNKPYYFTKTDSSGNFNIENVAEGKYKLYAFLDNNNNLLYNTDKEMIGFLKEPIVINSNKSLKNIPISKIEILPNKVLKSNSTANYYNIQYNRGIKKVKIEFKKASDSLHYQQMDSREIRFFNINQNTIDTIKISITLTDSLDREFKHEQKVKFKPKSKKDLNTKDAFEFNTIPENGQDIDIEEVGYRFKFSKPIKKVDFSKIIFKNDTIKVIDFKEKDYIWNNDKTELTLKKKIDKAKEKIGVEILKNAFFSIENDTNRVMKNVHEIRDPEKYGIISGEIKNPSKKGFIVQLLDEKYNKVDEVVNIDRYKFTFVKAGIYFVRVIVDENRNARWDFGDVDKNELPENIIFSKEKIKLKQNFEISGYDFTIE
jgi:uncharacterized protein (DUF2141 family)